jgi:hypothetical protein
MKKYLITISLVICIVSSISLAGTSTLTITPVPKPVTKTAVGVDIETLKKALFVEVPNQQTLRIRSSAQNSPQMQAIKQLEAAGSEDAITVLLECLTSNKMDCILKQNALTALGRIGIKPAIEAIKKFESWCRNRYSNPQPFYMGPQPSPIDHLITAPAISLAQTVDSEKKTWSIVPLSRYGRLELFLTSQIKDDTWSEPILLDISGFPELRIKSETEWNIKCHLQVVDDSLMIECNDKIYASRISNNLKDSDKDGLPDIVEARLLTDPKKSDSDGDSIPDGKDSNPLTPKHKDVNDTTEIRQAVFSVMFATSNSRDAIVVVDRDKFAKQEYYGSAGPVLLSSKSIQGFVNLTSIDISSVSEDSTTVNISDYVGSESASQHEVRLKKINGKWVVVEFQMTLIS